MPKINRIRVLNFSYNNFTRHITDEMFDFYKGENALLSLANGGGKSVLVQVMLQPIVPGAKIQGRKFADFFKTSKLPCFIMIEWKLDYSSDYLLTGIVCENHEFHGMDGEKNSRLRFFMFTSKYSQSNSYDISNIGFSARKGNVINVMNYKKAREFADERAKKSSMDFRIFSQENMEEYREHLSEYGISQDEWKNIIIGINDSEGGLDEIFQKCKNSDQLINEWFLNKTILKVFYKDKNQAGHLGQMMSNLVDEIIRNEEFLIEKELLQNFSEKLEDFSKDIEIFTAIIENKENTEKKIKYIENILSDKIEQLEKEENDISKFLIQAEYSLKNIDYEERSLDYYNSVDKLEILEKRKITLLEKINILKDNIKKLNIFLEKLRFKKIYDKKINCENDLKGYNEKILSLEKNSNIQERLSHIEYSLKIKFDERIVNLQNQYKNIENNKQISKQNLEEILIKQKEFKKTINSSNISLGSVNEKAIIFEKYQLDFEKNNNVKILRNILGQIDIDEFNLFISEIENKIANHNNEILQINEQNLKLENKLQNNSDLIKDFSNKVRDNILLYQKKIDEIALFTDKRDKSYEILKKYELKKQRIFDKKHIEFEFKNILIDYDNRKKELSSDIKLIENIIKGIKQNSLHIDQNIIDILINNNIEFETGENFIKNQKKDNRNSLLEKNPLLAYSIILKKDQINKVKDVFKDKFIKSSIPLFFYENTNVDFENNNVFIKINEDLNFIVNVEKRIFEIDKTEKFLNEKENEKKSLENIYKDIANSYNIASNDFRILQEFDYKEDFLYQAEKNERDLLQKTNEIEKKIEILNNENKNAEINIRNNINKLNEKQNKLNLLNVKLHDFNEFIVKDSEYVRILEKRKNLQKTIEKLNKDILLNENEIIKINNEISGLNKNIEIIKNKLTECEKYKLKFSNAQEKSEILKENIEELLSIYENLKKEYSKDFSALIILKEKSINEISEFTKELSRFKFNEEEVNNIEYNIEIEEKTEIDIYLQNNKLNSIISDYNIVDKDISSENRGKEQAFKEIERLDYDKACPRENIKQDFIARKNTINSNRKDYILLEKKLRKEIAEFKKIKQRIDILNLPSSSIIEFDIKDNIEIIYKNLESNYKLFKEQMDNEEKQLIGNYSLLRSEFKHKNQNIDNLFTSIDSMIERKNKKYNEYYYLFERLKDYIIKISELIEINRIRLENVEKNRNDVVFQCFVHAQRVFEELGKIALSSSVKLSEKIRPIQMIKINTDIDNEENAKKRIEKYIDSCIQNIREEKRQNYENEKINKSIFRLMSTRELINQYSGRNSIPVSVYKIDLNTANNRWKKWESAISENSGGEKFVVFFAVISALMAYIRNNTMINNSENLAGKDSRILIMDNPFGPISSQHLLIPLFEIAKKFNTQLICLSDLKQNSIFNCFNLIYMLKIKKSTFEKDEYLKIDRQIKNSENISLDENLEKSIFRTEKLENQQLF